MKVVRAGTSGRMTGTYPDVLCRPPLIIAFRIARQVLYFPLKIFLQFCKPINYNFKIRFEFVACNLGVAPKTTSKFEYFYQC